jgi:hypothetical protein
MIAIKGWVGKMTGGREENSEDEMKVGRYFSKNKRRNTGSKKGLYIERFRCLSRIQ